MADPTSLAFRDDPGFTAAGSVKRGRIYIGQALQCLREIAIFGIRLR